MGKFRLTLALLLTILLAACQTTLSSDSPTPIEYLPQPTGKATSSSVTYEIVESMAITSRGPGQPDKQNLWIALIDSDLPFQEVLALEITPGDYQLITDEYGNRYAEFDLSDFPAGSSIPIDIRYQVQVNPEKFDLTACEGNLPDFSTAPELHVESQNPQIQALAHELSEGKENACQKIAAFYNYIGNNLVYSYNGRNWGAQAALGPMGADCTEYASLMMALSRAAGIPARYVEGLFFNPDGSQEKARTEHAWLEVYLPGVGWTPMDPTLGRSSIDRESYFATHTADHIIVSLGRNPSTLRGGSYWTHLYWPGQSTDIQVEDFSWEIHPAVMDWATQDIVLIGVFRG